MTWRCNAGGFVDRTGQDAGGGGDSPGFVVNRILMPYLDEAVRLIAEGVKIDKIDGTMKRFGMPMGPLELLDQVGLDVAAHVAASMQPALAGRFPSLEAFERLAPTAGSDRRAARVSICIAARS